MESKYKYFLLIVVAAFLAIGTTTFVCCNSNNKDKKEEKSKQKKELSDDEVMELAVKKWNEALNNRDSALLERMYAPVVFLYTRSMSGHEAVMEHKKSFDKEPNYSQYIEEIVNIEDSDNGVKRVNFIKKTSHGNSYHCYLELTKIDGKWRITKESDRVTDENVRRKEIKTPSDALKGDFDGDGVTDKVWVEKGYDSDDYLVSKQFKSNCENLNNFSLPNASRDYILINVGKLDDGDQDYLGVIPCYDSTWCMYYLYKFKDGKWTPALDEFQIWMGDDDLDRVSKSSKKGYVKIFENNMEADDPFSIQSRLVKLKL